MRTLIGLALIFIGFVSVPLVSVAAAEAEFHPACKQDASDIQMRANLEGLLRGSLDDEVAKINFAELVDRKWADAAMDKTIDKEVDAAVAVVREDTSWYDRFYSVFSSSSAAGYTKNVAEKFSNSNALGEALLNVQVTSTAYVIEQISKDKNLILGPAFNCMLDVLKAQHPTILEFSKQLADKLSSIEIDRRPAASTVRLAAAAAASMPLTSILKVAEKKLAENIAKTIERKIAISIAKKAALWGVKSVIVAIPLVGQALGGGALAKELYDANKGVFPEIEKELKSDNTKGALKNGMIEYIHGGIYNRKDSIVREMVRDVYPIWLKQKRLQSPDLQTAILESADPEAALLMVLRPNNGFADYGNMSDDLKIVLDGKVKFRVFLERYWENLLFPPLLLICLALFVRGLMTLMCRACWQLRLLFKPEPKGT
jgi:hypothetical protein